MSTFMVPIVPIKAIEPIDGADNIELAVVGEFRSVVKKGLFRPGKIVAYIPENAIVPQNVLIKLGLQGRLAGKNKDRVKPIRLRGCLSQGILYPVNQGRSDGVINLSISQPDNLDDNIDVKLGDNVADFLGITKYEPVIPANMSGEVYNAGQHITVNFDVEHYKMYPDALTDGQEVVFTEKLHGTFVGIGLLPPRDRGPQHVDSRFVVFSKGLGKQGLCFKDNDANANNLYLRTIKQLGVFDKLESLYNDHTLMMPLDAPVFLLGEIFGVGVQDLSYGCTKPTFRAFKVFQGYRDNMTMMSYDQFVSFTDYAGIERVPILYRGPFNKQVLQQYTTGTDTISGSHVREGLVIEPVNPVRDPRFGHVILKSVSDDYLFRGGKPTEYQ